MAVQTATIRHYAPELEDVKWVGFILVRNPKPKVLSPEQIGQYNEHGFIHRIQGIFSEAEVREHRVFFDEALSHALASGLDENAINGYHTKLRTIYDMATDPRLLEIVADLIDGDAFCCIMTNYLCKLPKDDKVVPAHQDAVYWPLDRSRIVQLYIAIDDQDEQNSAMQFVSGSHRLGKLAWHDTQADLSDLEGLQRTSGLWQQIDDPQKYGTLFSNNLKAGEISVFSDMTAHLSGPNRSDRRRCSLIMRYVPISVRAFELREKGTYRGWNANSIWVRGEDPANHWKNNPRPEGDDFVSVFPKGFRSGVQPGGQVFPKRSGAAKL